MVDNRITSDILKTRYEKLAAVIDKIKHPKLVASAMERWKPYEPQGTKCLSIGVDGSYNKKEFQGLAIYVVNAVAVNSSNQIIKLEFEHGPENAKLESLTGLSLLYEVKVTQQMLSETSAYLSARDLLLIDGSISAWLAAATSIGIRIFIDSLKNNTNNFDKFGMASTIFVSKNSGSQKQFDGTLADMFYYNHIHDMRPGFSLPFQNDDYLKDFGITIIEVYARLKTFTPMIKLELVNTSGKSLTKDELGSLAHFDIPRLLDKMVYHSIAGYPHCLRLAHDNCLISEAYIDRVLHLYGLVNEISSRAPLHERKHPARAVVTT